MGRDRFALEWGLGWDFDGFLGRSRVHLMAGEWGVGADNLPRSREFPAEIAEADGFS